jgi:hypothetical protein
LNVQARRVSEWEVRKVFNDLGLAEKVVAGELNEWIERDVPSRPELGLPPGTRTRTAWYLDSQLQKVAFVHYYLLPDGSIGASGKVDPKRIILDDEIIFC